MSSGRSKGTFSSDVKLLQSASYQPLTSVTRCLHLDDVLETFKRKRICAYRINNTKTFIDTEVVWFAPSAASGHNYYGNVSFEIDWETLFQTLGPHLFLLDQAIHKRHSYTRILLTKHYAKYGNILPDVDVSTRGSALMEINWEYLYASRCSNSSHELQIAVEATVQESKWLYQNSAVSANDHHCVNRPITGIDMRQDGQIRKFESYRCFKYNTALNAICPYSYNKKETKNKLMSLCPSIFEDKVDDSSAGGSNFHLFEDNVDDSSAGGSNFHPWNDGCGGENLSAEEMASISRDPQFGVFCRHALLVLRALGAATTAAQAVKVLSDYINKQN